MNLFGHDAVDYSDSAASKGSQEKYLIFVAPTIFWVSVQLLLIRSDFKAMVIVMFTKLKMVRGQISDPVHGGGDGDLDGHDPLLATHTKGGTLVECNPGPP